MSLGRVLGVALNVSRASKGFQPRLQQPMMRMMSSLSAEFEQAKAKLNSLPEDPGNEAKLKIYALFKQATQGQVSTSRPGMMDFVGRAKWDAWNALADMTQEDAQKAYVDLVNELAGASSSAAPAAEPGKYKYIESTLEGGLRIIKFNRPAKKNAFLKESYDEIAAALQEAADDPKTVITVTTGAGDFYSSGNDLSNFTNIQGDIKDLAKESGKLLNRFVSAFIDFPKPLVAVVNGPAIGVSVTLMGMYDAVYATDRATFHTPFSSLGQSPEGCSSYTFPQIMGPGKAAEMLLFNKKLTAHEAERVGLVTEVLPADAFHQEIWARLRQHAELPVKSLVYSKALTRDRERQLLHEVNDIECDRLVERWTSDDCVNAIMKFFSAKSKM
ncbi:enoyl-CoA delta isomerase 2-like [Pollicipes pollicipes]|uniref:enoyl-CoA delta isomerase 2-like n=1 Tax=Pollicipes pollicipes TaxID=41117 RepID=UPI0018858B6F|nr:enoyl-CoA delta isomerase 2-like [Pollicipes pollicipes]